MNNLTAPWKTITLSPAHTAEYYLKTLQEVGISGNDAAIQMLTSDSFRTTDIERTIELVMLTQDDIQHTISDVIDPIAHGLELGLVLCPPDVGPALRLQYLDQPRDTMICVAMEPLEPTQDTVNGPQKSSFILSCSSEGTLGLMGLSLDWYNRSAPESQFIFVKK